MYAALRRRLAADDVLLGTVVTLRSPESAEVLAESGFDWLFLDTEHSPLGAADVQSIVQAVGDRCPCLVRVAGRGESWIKQALDAGAAGVIVPQVNSAEDAAAVVSWCKYPPEGARGIGLGRAQRYGLGLGEYLDTANRDTSVVVQIEHIRAVENIESIVAVAGIDVVFVGPYDLSASLGKTGRMDDPELGDAIQRVTQCCRSSGVALGIFGAHAAAVKPWIERGYTLIAVATDCLFLASSGREALAALGR